MEEKSAPSILQRAEDNFFKVALNVTIKKMKPFHIYA